MTNIEKEIEKVLSHNNINIDKNSSIAEALEKIFVFKEELRFQNDELRRINHDIEVVKQDYEELFTEAPIAYLLLDDDMNINKANSSAVDLLKCTDLNGKHFSNFIEPKSQDAFYRFKRNIDKRGNTSIELGITVLDEVKYIKLFSNQTNNKVFCKYRFALLDETLVHEQQEKVSYLSLHDQLTGCYNRHFLQEELTRIDHKRSYPLGIIMADLNGLKLINDGFGHNIGDELIKQAAFVLDKSIRGNDILARVGGDEFIIVLPKTTELSIKQIIQRMKTMADGIAVKDIKLSIAYGFSIKNNPKEDIDNIMKRAESSMYKDKLTHKTGHKKYVITSILDTLHKKYPQEALHSQMVSKYAVMMGNKLGFSPERIKNLQDAGALHDIGKISIDASILDKPGPLTTVEYEEIKKHPAVGYRILSSSGTFSEISDIVLSHHEHVDGTGYPRGLKDDELIDESKIISICEAYSTMTVDTSYRKAISKDEALKKLEDRRGTQFNSELLDVFIQSIKNND